MAVSLRIGTGPNAGQVIPANSETDVVNGIHAGDDVLVDGSTATVGNRDGSWYLNGALVCTYFNSCKPVSDPISSTTSTTSSTSSTSSTSTTDVSGGMAMSPAVLIGIALALLWAVD